MAVCKLHLCIVWTLMLGNCFIIVFWSEHRQYLLRTVQYCSKIWPWGILLRILSTNPRVRLRLGNARIIRSNHVDDRWQPKSSDAYLLLREYLRDLDPSESFSSPLPTLIFCTTAGRVAVLIIVLIPICNLNIAANITTRSPQKQPQGLCSNTDSSPIFYKA